MSDSNEFTTREKYPISLYKDPAEPLSKSPRRSLDCLMLSIGLVAYGLVRGETTFVNLGHGSLLFDGI